MKTKAITTIAVALLASGALVTSCSIEDNTVDTTPQTMQPPTGPNAITFTATLAPKEVYDSQTRSISVENQGTPNETLNVAWKEGEKISLRYQKSDDSWAKVKATVGTPNADGSAPFTATLTDAKDGATAVLIYPYSLANKEGDDISWNQLKDQSGYLTKLGSGADNSICNKYDYAMEKATITVNDTGATVTGPVVMKNQCCICKFSFPNIKTDETENYYWITFNITNGEVTTTYTAQNVKKDDMQAVYMALLPDYNVDIVITVQGYNKTSEYDTGTAKHTYSIVATDMMLDRSKFYRNFVVTFNYYPSTVVIPDDETFILSDADIDVSSGPAIRCEGNATIILTGTNRVMTSAEGQPAIFVPEGKTLTIQGSGSVTATGGYYAAGIGGGEYGGCGTITISGGTVTATGGKYAAGIGGGEYGGCGTITISGGIVTATGGFLAAGIGSGAYSTCGDITIGSDVTSVSATMGYCDGVPIGSVYSGSCGTVTIDGTTTWTAGTATEHFNWNVSTVEGPNDQEVTCWTLTHK